MEDLGDFLNKEAQPEKVRVHMSEDNVCEACEG